MAPAYCVTVHGLVEVHVFLSLEPVGADGFDKQAGLLAVRPLPPLAILLAALLLH